MEGLSNYVLNKFIASENKIEICLIVQQLYFSV